MTKRGHSNSVLFFFIGVSLFGMFVTAAIAIVAPRETEATPWRKLVLGSIFMLICISGSVAAVFPKKCSIMSEIHVKEERKRSAVNNNSQLVHVKGHHYDCGRFSAHVINVRGQTLCAACTGLFIGAIGALSFAFLYFFAGLEFENLSISAVLIGLTGVGLGFLQLKSAGMARLILNVCFVIGTCTVLIGMDMLTKNLTIDFYLICLIIFWIWTRTLLSEWDHRRTCSACKNHCK